MNTWICGEGGCWHGAPIPWWAALGLPVFIWGCLIVWQALMEIDARWTLRQLRKGIRQKQKPYVMESHSHRQARPKAMVSTRRWPPAWLKR